MKPFVRPITAAAVLTVTLTSCGEAADTAAEESPEVSQEAEAALASIEGEILGECPDGSEPVAADSIAELTPEEVEQIQAMDATAAIVMHFGGNDWSTAQVEGLEAEFADLGIEVVAVTDAGFKPDKQVSDLQTALVKDPDIIVSIPTDPVATASAYQAAADAGVELVFMDNVPQGLTPGEDYASVVSADNYGNGVVSAHLLAKALGGEGEIGVIFHEADFFVTRERYEGFKTTVEQEYPEIEIVEETGIAGPDFAGDAQAAANAMLTANPNLDGIWAVWDVPAEGVLAAARAAGRNDLKIATQDLGTNVAIALAKDELVVGLGAQRPFDQGVIEARLAAAALLGKETPTCVAAPALAVEHENVLQAWEQVYGEEPPAELRESFTE
jgi:ribose transport system substrate-binding protein